MFNQELKSNKKSWNFSPPTKILIKAKLQTAPGDSWIQTHFTRQCFPLSRTRVTVRRIKTRAVLRTGEGYKKDRGFNEFSNLTYSSRQSHCSNQDTIEWIASGKKLFTNKNPAHPLTYIFHFRSEMSDSWMDNHSIPTVVIVCMTTPARYFIKCLVLKWTAARE